MAVRAIRILRAVGILLRFLRLIAGLLGLVGIARLLVVARLLPVLRLVVARIKDRIALGELVLLGLIELLPGVDNRDLPDGRIDLVGAGTLVVQGLGPVCNLVSHTQIQLARVLFELALPRAGVLLGQQL